MTSLAAQLERLSVPYTQSVLATDKRRASLLFDPKEAANLDRHAVYAIGMSGLEELEGLNPEFSEYANSLFNVSSQTWERTMQSSEVNNTLNETLESFLIQLSPYFMLKCSHKALEWLIYRYHIHQMNTDALLRCAFPYHETKMFVRLVQLLPTDKATHRWHWVHAAGKMGVPLTRSTIINHCRSDPSFLTFICDLVTTFIKGLGATNHNLRAVVALWTCTILGVAAERIHVTEKVMSILVPALVRGLKSSCLDMKAASYMVLAQLASHSTLEPKFVKSILHVIAKYISPKLTREVLMCLALLCKTQSITEIEKKSIKRICRVPAFVPLLAVLADNYDITDLLRCILDHLIPKAVKMATSASLTSSSAASDDELGLSGAVQFDSLLAGIISEVAMETNMATDMAKHLIIQLVLAKESGRIDDEWQDAAKSYLSPFQARYAVSTDLAVEALVGGETKEVDPASLQAVLQAAMGGTKGCLIDGSTSLLLAINHVHGTTRALAVTHLGDVLRETGEGLGADVGQMLLQRLDDCDMVVVQAVVDLGDVLEEAVPVAQLAECLLDLVDKRHSDPPWMTVVHKVVRLLCGPKLAGVTPNLGLRLLPYILLAQRDPAGLSTALLVMTSHLAFTDSILKNFSKKWVLHAQLPAPEAAALNHRMISGCVSTILTASDTQCTQMVESLLEGAKTNRKLRLIAVCVLSEVLQSDVTNIIGTRMAGLLLQVVQAAAEGITKVNTFSTTSNNIKRYLADWVSDTTNGDTELTPSALWWALRALVAYINKEKSNLPDDAWWSMEDPLVSVVVQTLDVLVKLTCVTCRTSSNMKVWQQLVHALTQETLDLLSLSRLAVLLWQLHLGSGGHYSVSTVLQVAICHLVARAWCSAQPNTLVTLLEGTNSPVLAGLLVCLGSREEALRVGAVLCVKAARQATNKQLGHFTLLFKKVFKQQQEITADNTHLQNILRKVLAKDTDLCELVTYWVVESQTPPAIRERLLFHLQTISNKFVLEDLLSIGREVIALCGTAPPGVTPVHMQMLHHLVARMKPADCPTLTADSVGLQLLLSSLQVSHRLPGCHLPPAIVMGQISAEFFNALPSTKERALVVSALLDIGESPPNPDVANQACSLLQQFHLDWEPIQYELVVDVEVPPPTVKGRKLQRVKKSGAKTSPSWKRVIFLLEALQKRKSMKHSQPCVAALFTLLTRSLTEEGDDVEYRQRLLLALIQNLTNRWQQQQITPKQENVHVEALVQVVRNPTANTQTKKYALAVMANLAFYFPEVLLHHVMSIFTFVGVGLLAADDEHSLNVVSHTITTIVPALLGARSNSAKASDHLTNQIVQVFVDAQRSIPRHRSLAVFTTLVTTLGVETSLWRVIVLLVTTACQHRDTEVATGNVAETADVVISGSLKSDLEFGIHLCEQFDVNAVVETATELVHFLQWLAEQHEHRPKKATGSKRKKSAYKESCSSIVDVATLSGHQLRLLQFHLTRLLTLLLSTEAVVTQVVKGDVTDVTGFHIFVKEVVVYLLAVARTHNALLTTTHAKFWKAIMSKAYEVTDKVLYLLPTTVLLDVVKSLLELDLHGVRRKALELLASKLQALLVTPPSPSQYTPLLPVIDILLKIATSENPTHDADVTATQQMALFNLKLLCKVLGEQNQASFVEVLKAVMVRVTVSEPPAVVGNALLLEAEVLTVVRAHAIQYLPNLINPLLTLLADVDFIRRHELVLTCGLTSLHRLVVTLPHFLSPYLDNILTVVCQLNALMQDSDKKSQAALRLSAIRHQLATVIAPRVLIPALGNTFTDLLTSASVSQMLSALTCVMLIAAEHVTCISKENLTDQHTPLLDMFCDALDLRNANTQLSLVTVTAVETAVIEAMLAMVVHLSEASFRPMFYKLYDWGCREHSHETKLRKLTFFKLADSLAGKLRSLFNLFVGQTLQTASTLLIANNSLNKDVSYFGSDATGETLSGQLVGYILDCLCKCMKHDTEEIFTGDVFNLLLQPIIDQMENFVGGDAAYEARMPDHVVPCLSHFMVAAREDSHRKLLNYQILLKARHTSSKVRFTALRVIAGVAEQMGDEYMMLLPETIPFLAELMEDECEEVERECQVVIAKLEEVLGESLQKYF